MKILFCIFVFAVIFSSVPAYPQWVQQTLPGDIDVTLGIDFINENIGVMGGWHINLGGQLVGNAFYTANAGTNWFEAAIPDSMRVIVDLQMLNANTAYGAGAYNQTLIQSNLNSNPSQPLNPLIKKYYEKIGINFSAQEDYRGYFVETTDGGLTWHPKGSFEDSVYYLVGIYFFDQQTGFVLASGPSANSSAILKTSDNGVSWSYVYSFETGLTLNSIKFINQLEGIAVGTSVAIPGNVGIILRTTDGGNTWMRTELSPLAAIDDVTYIDFNSILVSGVKTDFSAVIYRSDDGGNNWFESCNYGGLSFISGINSIPGSGITIVYGQEQPIGSAFPFIEISLDGGVTWSYNQLSLLQDYYPTFSEMVTQERWYLTGTRLPRTGFVLFTDNSGGVPVELVSFNAETVAGNIRLNWATASELNNMGFEVERKSDNEDWRITGFVEGNGTTTEKQNYYYTDNLFGINSTKLNYRLKQIDFDGTYKYSDAVEVVRDPVLFSLEQNYPNPFNPGTIIRFSLPQSSFVTLEIFNTLGESLGKLVSEDLSAGTYNYDWDGTGLTSGIYFYKIQAGDFVEIKKMILIK